MDRETFLTPGRLVELTGITSKRLEQQVQRHGADPEAPADARALPITKAEPGRHPRYTFADALMIACAIQLERCGVDFSQAVRFTKLARVSAFITSNSADGDLWFAAWADESSATDGDGGSVPQTVFGSFRDVSRRLPVDRFATVSLNVSQVARGLEAKLRAAGIERDGFRLVERENLL